MKVSYDQNWGAASILYLFYGQSRRLLGQEPS